MIDRALQNKPYIQVNHGIDDDNVNGRPDGNTRSYALRRLRNEAPELHARVLNGDLSSHAAMLEAGFRKKTIQSPCTVDGVVRTIQRHFNADDIAAIVEKIGVCE